MFSFKAMEKTTKIFDAKPDMLDKVIAFAEEEMSKIDVPLKDQMKINVSLEELFVNVAHYAYPDGVGTAEITITTEDRKITIEIKDSGIPFNPLLAADPDISLSAEDRGIGGLGILMVKKTMDEFTYRYENSFNINTISKLF
ncbi:MAG: ATP-binding protein [Eubacteriales bacterium]|nr:ATP-binding protein [Eubacteriales bacterium]